MCAIENVTARPVTLLLPGNVASVIQIALSSAGLVESTTAEDMYRGMFSSGCGM